MIKKLFLLLFGMMTVSAVSAQHQCQEGQHQCKEAKHQCQEGQQQCQEAKHQCQEGQHQCQKAKHQCKKAQQQCQQKQCDHRVSCGMTKAEVMKVAGEPASKDASNAEAEVWVYPRANNVVVEVTFDSQERVKMVREYVAGDVPPSPPTNAMQKKALPAIKKH